MRSSSAEFDSGELLMTNRRVVICRFLGAVVTCCAIGVSLAAPSPAGVPATSGSGASKPTEALPAARDKLLYLFYRRPDITRAEYQRKYVELHAPLGMQYFRGVIGYTVNLVLSAGGPDAVTELWVPSAVDQLDPGKSLKPYQPEDMARVEADQKARGGTMIGFVVDEAVLRGRPIDYEVGRTPDTKFVWLYHRGQPVPPPPQGAWRVVDNRVLHNPDGPITNGKWTEGNSDITLIRMAWASDAAQLGNDAAGAMIVTEWRFRPSPWQ